MPANLPAEAKAWLAKYSSARSLEDKIRALENALSYIPSHKGTEKLRAQLKKRLSQLKRESSKPSHKAVRHDEFAVTKEGIGQVVLIGIANSGKSSLLRALTRSSTPIAEYPLTTTKPAVGMMDYEDVKIQLVELPSVMTMELEETSFSSRSLAFARNSDLVCLVVDGSYKPSLQLKKMISILDDHAIWVGDKVVTTNVEKRDSGGIRIMYEGDLKEDIRKLEPTLASLGIKNAVVKISSRNATLEDIEDHIIREIVWKKALVIINKSDSLDLKERGEAHKISSEAGLRVVETSCLNRYGLDELKRTIFESLNVIRVYTQKDGVVSRDPIVLKRGATVKDLAERIHKEIAARLRYAKVWGRSVKLQGQQVGVGHVLNDGDVVELFRR